MNLSFLLHEKLPGIQKVEDIGENFWKLRYEQIRQFEGMLANNGLVILKFFLHVSKEEQQKRLLERIDDKDKNWKFDMYDLKARSLWQAYQNAYEQTFKETAAKHAPWYIIPADDKCFARALIAKILKKSLQGLDVQPPQLTEEARANLELAKIQLQSQ